MENKNKPIASYKDLEVYRESYDCMLVVMKEVLPELPHSERFDLKDQLSRSRKAIPRLIAEGYGKRHQRAGFQKYLDDAMAENNETVVGLEQAKDIYAIKPELLTKLIGRYTVLGRRLYRLRASWQNFKTPTP